MNQLSIDAFYSAKRLSREGTKTRRVLNAISDMGTATAKQVVIRTGIPINVVAGRMCDLKKSGQIVQDGEVYDEETECYSSAWRIDMGTLAMLQDKAVEKKYEDVAN